MAMKDGFAAKKNQTTETQAPRSFAGTSRFTKFRNMALLTGALMTCSMGMATFTGCGKTTNVIAASEAPGSVYSTNRPAIIAIKNSNGAVVDQQVVSVGKPFNYTDDQGKTWTVKVNSTNAGFTLNEKSADMDILDSNGQKVWSGVWNVGDEAVLPNFRVQLQDISISVSDNIVPFAIISVKDSTGLVLAQLEIAPGATSNYTDSNGRTYTIKVTETGAGFTLNAKYAKIEISKNGQVIANGTLDVGAGQSIDAGNIKIALDDLSVAQTISPEDGKVLNSPALLKVLDGTGVCIGELKIYPGQESNYTFPNGQTVTIKVDVTAPGYTLSAKWVKLESFLPNGQVSASGTINVGDSLDVGSGKVQVSDIGTAEWH